MRLRSIICIAAVLFMALDSPAWAGPYADDLSKCIVRSSSDRDQTLLINWFFSILSLNPAVRPLASISSEQRKSYDKQVAKLFERLMLSDCRKEAISAIKYEGMDSIQTSFGVLGQAAVRQLMSDPSVTAGMSSFTAYIDKSQFEKFAAEAGVSATSLTK